MESLNLSTVAIGIIAGVISSFFTYFFQIRLEKKKKELEIENLRKSEFKKDIANTVQTIMALVHEVAWISWEVNRGQGERSKVYLAGYNKRAKSYLGKLSEQLALLAAKDLQVYEEIRKLAKEVYSLDLRLSDSLVRYISDELDESHFADLKKQANKMDNELPMKFSDILRSVDKK